MNHLLKIKSFLLLSDSNWSAIAFDTNGFCLESLSSLHVMSQRIAFALTKLINLITSTTSLLAIAKHAVKNGLCNCMSLTLLATYRKITKAMHPKMRIRGGDTVMTVLTVAKTAPMTVSVHPINTSTYFNVTCQTTTVLTPSWLRQCIGVWEGLYASTDCRNLPTTSDRRYTHHSFVRVAPKESFARLARNCIKIVSERSVATYTTDFIFFGFSPWFTATAHGSTIHTQWDTISGRRRRSRRMYRTIVVGIQATLCIHQWILTILRIHFWSAVRRDTW